MGKIDNELSTIRAFTALYNKFTWIYKSRYLFQKKEIGIALTGAEASIFIELSHLKTTTAKQLRLNLGMDQGYLSKIIKKFEKAGLVSRTPLKNDARYQVISLTKLGEQLIDNLNNVANMWYEERLTPYSKDDIKSIAFHMKQIMKVISKKEKNAELP